MNFSQSTLLITGIDGFIGLRTAELAIAQGMKVRGLQSSLAKDDKVKNLGIEVIIASINDPAIAQKACQGIDIVLHTDQFAEEAGSLDHFRQINVGGSVNIAQAARNAGVKTFVHLSTLMVYGFDYPNGVMESGALTHENNPYCQTKIEAEAALLKLNNPPDFGIIIIRAGDVYGPGSISWVVKPILMMRQKLFAYANDGKGVINHLYIDNLINAIFLAIEKETYGEIFNITDGQETSWKEYFTRLAEVEGLPTPFSLPKDQIKLFLQMRVRGQKLFRKKIDILPESIDFMTRPYACSIEKAKSLLNYQPIIDLEEGIKITHQWLQETDIQSLIG